MLMYFLIFTVVGFVIGVVVKSLEKSIPFIIGISILWGFVYAPVWGLATLGELSLGFYIFTMLNQNNESFVD